MVKKVLVIHKKKINKIIEGFQKLFKVYNVKMMKFILKNF